ncbi:esterase/lipase family protein [Leifsonia sp. Le1]|uniref:esterase/lipase family protein n=1 Tax=Leifsonia sp. Le1 TaxID=3404918 RepID=UPI003EBCAE9C
MTAQPLRRAGVSLRKAGVWMLDYLYAARHQLRAAVSRDDPEVLAAGRPGASTVVLLPGILETWRFMLPLARHLHDRGNAVHVIAALGRNRLSIADGAELVAAHLDEHDLHDVTIVAHSKGGLIAKQLMSSLPAGGRVRLAVTVCTPFAGSVYARYLPTRSLRSLAPTDATLLRLGRESAANERIVSVYGWFDPHIPGGSALEGARNVELPVGGHFRILASRELLEVVDGCV